jgi:hypothetical protein
MVEAKQDESEQPGGLQRRAPGLARSLWAIPLLTALGFVASTVLAYLVCRGNYGHGSYGIGDAQPMAIVCFFLGAVLGFLVRWGAGRKLRSRPGLTPILVLVGLCWGAVFLFQALIFWWMVMSF